MGKEKLTKGKYLPKSKYRKALVYFVGLDSYLSNAEAQLGNNVNSISKYQKVNNLRAVFSTLTKGCFH